MPFRSVHLILVAWACIGFSVAQNSSAYQRGVQLYNQAKYTEALDAFNQAIAADPRDSNAYRQSARCRQRLEDLQGALADLNKALELDPRNVRALTDRSGLRRRLKDVTGAVDDINRAIELDPKNAGAYNNRGLLRWDAKDYKGALADYDYSVSLDPKQSPVFNNRGLVKEKLNDFEGALADYTNAIENNPKNADAYSNRAFCRKQMGDAVAARLDYESALAIEPAHKFASAQLKKLGGEGIGTPIRETVAVQQQPQKTVAPSPGGATATLPSVHFKATDPCQAAKTVSGLPWQPRSGARVSPPAGIPVATLSPFLDFHKMSAVQYNGAVSVAMEGMRLLYGEMSAEDQQKFEAAWAPLFDFPTPAAVDYLNKLNPLLGEFLAGREEFIRTTAAVNAAIYDSALAVAANTRDAYIDALARADRQGQVLRSLEGGLTQIAGQIQALGNPPNPLAAKCAAQERYRRSLPATPSVLDGEWLTESGARLYYKTIKRYPNGMTLLYHYSFSFAEKLEKAGVSAAKPGFESNKEGGFIMVPGMEDVLMLVEEQPGGMLFTSPLELGITLMGFFPDGERVHIVRYATGVRNDFVFSGSTLYRAVPICDTTPVLPGHNWEKILGVAKQFEADRITRLKNAKLGSPAQLQALMSCNPLNLPAPPKQKNPWDEGPYKADDPRSKLPPPAETPKFNTRVPKPPSQAAEVATTQETIAFHQSIIETLNSNLQKEQADLNRELDPERRKQLAFRMIQLQSDIQAEQDLVASYRTGQIVHTRSAFDEFAHDQFIHNIRQEAARVDATRRIAAVVEEQIEQAPEEARAALRQKARGILDSKTIASGDVEKASKLANSLGTIIQGYKDQQAASQEEKAIDRAEMEFYFNSAVMVAGVGVIGFGSAALASTYGETAAIAVWGPHLIGGVYGGAHGLMAGGPVEGAKQAIAWSSPFGFMATQFAEGFVQAGNDPKAGWEDAVWAGAKQAGTGYLIGKAMQFGAGLTGKGALALLGEDSTFFKPLVAPGRNVTQAFAAAKMEQDVADALSLINHFKGKQAAMAKMRAQMPAGSPEIAAAEKELTQLAASLNSSYHCKLLLKYHAHPSVRRYFSSLVDKSYEEAIPEMLQILKSQHYDISNLRFKSCRNSSSAGSSSMDLDLALQETPNMVILKNGKPVTVAEFQNDAQKALNQAYHKVTGFSATRSEVNLTTSAHSESYATRSLLRKNVNFGQLTPEEVASVGKVLGVKLDKIQGDPVLSQIAKFQSQCRESAKEIENMLLKELKQKLAAAPTGSKEAQQIQADINYWSDMLKNFKQISMQETNPYTILQLDRAIRAQTGGKGAQEVSRDLTRAFYR